MTAPVGERASPVDPRLRARRREIRRDRGRRRLRRLQAGLGVVAVGAGGWVAALSPVFDVDRLRVQGVVRSEADVIVAAAGIDRHEAMLTLDLAGAAADIEAQPWVATATVTRHWPGDVVVTVTERQPQAMVATRKGRWVVVDRDRRQLAVVDEGAFPELARIVGLAPDAEPGALVGEEAGAALELAGLLPAVVPGVVPEVKVAPGGLEVSMSGGGGGEPPLVRFGGPTRLADKVDALAALVDADVLDEIPPPAVVDVRVPDAPVLTRTGG